MNLHAIAASNVGKGWLTPLRKISTVRNLFLNSPLRYSKLSRSSSASLSRDTSPFAESIFWSNWLLEDKGRTCELSADGFALLVAKNGVTRANRYSSHCLMLSAILTSNSLRHPMTQKYSREREKVSSSNRSWT